MLLQKRAKGRCRSVKKNRIEETEKNQRLSTLSFRSNDVDKHISIYLVDNSKKYHLSFFFFFLSMLCE